MQMISILTFPISLCKSNRMMYGMDFTNIKIKTQSIQHIELFQSENSGTCMYINYLKCFNCSDMNLLRILIFIPTINQKLLSCFTLGGSTFTNYIISHQYPNV